MAVLPPYALHLVAFLQVDTSKLPELSLFASATSANYSGQTANSFTVDNGGVTFAAFGDNLTYDGNGVPTGGNIGLFRVQYGSSIIYQFDTAGAVSTLSVATFYALFGSGQEAAVFSVADEQSGSGFDDRLSGLSGDDQLYGGDGDDRLLGGPGNDFLAGGNGNDILNGGPGYDTVSFGGLTPVHVTLNGSHAVLAQIGGNQTDTLKNIEGVWGTLGDDILVGDGHANTFRGFAGHDVISGHGGDDLLNGGHDSDILKGGPGHDTFEFDTAFALSHYTNIDTIKGFHSGIDRIAIMSDLVDPLPVGTLSEANFLAAPHAIHGVAEDYIVYDTLTGNLYYDHSGNGTSMVFQMMHLSGHPTLHASDISIFADYFF